MDDPARQCRLAGTRKRRSRCCHVLEGGEHVSLLQQAGGGAEADEPHELVRIAACGLKAERLSYRAVGSSEADGDLKPSGAAERPGLRPGCAGAP